MSAKHPLSPHNVGSVLRFLLLFLLPFTLLGFFVKSLHYSLPTPSYSSVDNSTGLPIFSEKRALDVIHYLADTLGYRIVGTLEMKQAEDFVLYSVQQIKDDLDGTAMAGFHEIEIWHQQQPGQHLFDFMEKKVWKKYFLGNVIVRLSDGTEQSKANSILVNGHIDSTLPSPGAADDGAGIGVMIETLRVMANTPRKLHNSVIFLFNGGEESLQDASHLFITRSPLRKNVRAVINLEACGTAGPEILFQATSRQMIEAYSHVPRPFGTVLATEIFGTGILLSDTDFRQFVQYGNLTGLDMALIQNSYFYHTRRDMPDEIEPGALQHMGENTIALLNHLTSEKSNLTQIHASADTVFFSALGGRIFVVLSSEVASTIYVAIASCFVYLIGWGITSRDIPVLFTALFSVPASFLSSIVCANIVAIVMEYVVQKPLSWFRHEYYAILLFGPPTLVGAFLTQLWFSRYAKARPELGLHNQKREHIVFLASALFYLIITLFAQFMKIMSAYLGALTAASLLVSGLLNDNFISKAGYVNFFTYVTAQIIPVVIGLEGLFTCVDLFVPLTGRIGADAPADNIIAVVVSLTIFMSLPMLLPFAHRFGEKVLVKLTLAMTALTIITMAVFSSPDWKVFDADHPKRLLILHMENITSQEMSFHVASMDRTPFHSFMEQTISSMGLPSDNLTPQDISTEIPDWDIIFPVSQFLRAYRVDLPQLPPAAYDSVWKDKFSLRVEDDRLNAVEQTRHMKLIIDHPEVIWPVISFEADVVEWDLPEPAERGHRRHHIKESSSYGHSQWSVTMKIRLDDVSFQAALRESQRRKGQRAGTSKRDADISTLKVWYSGLDKTGFYPHHAYKGPVQEEVIGSVEDDDGESLETKPSMIFFERLERVLPDDVDASLWSAISGVIKV